MLTAEQAADIRGRVERFGAWVDTKRGKSGWASYRPEEVPAELRAIEPTNEEKGALELFDFVTDQPERLFAYVTKDAAGWKCTAWPGNSYGSVTVGAPYQSPGFYGRSSTRRAVTLRAINGWVYAGTLYESSGEYARFKRTKQRC